MTDPWWRRLGQLVRWSRRELRAVVTVDRRAELPDRLDRRTTYVVGDPPQWVVFACPCAAGHDIALSLAPLGNWHLTTRRGRPTITPSVNAATLAGRCHYWVRDGRIRWCADTTR